MKKVLLTIFFCLLFFITVQAQSNQQKAQVLVVKYLNNKSNLKTSQNIKFSSLAVLRSSFADTKPYKNYQHQIDSLKSEGRKIDARIPKMKTTAEIDRAKKDSKQLSNQLVTVSDELIDFMTTYKGRQIGWMIKATLSTKNSRKKTFYLNQELSRVDSVR